MKKIVYDLIDFGSVKRAVLGITMQQIDAKIAELVESAVEEALKMRVTDNQYMSIKYFNVRNSKGKEYDFKHFDETCVELADEEVMNREVNYIASNVLQYIEGIGEALDEYLADRIC